MIIGNTVDQLLDNLQERAARITITRDGEAALRRHRLTLGAATQWLAAAILGGEIKGGLWSWLEGVRAHGDVAHKEWARVLLEELS